MALKEYCAEYWLKELQESIDKCTGCCDIFEILLKMALNTIQSINQSSSTLNLDLSKILLCGKVSLLETV